MTRQIAVGTTMSSPAALEDRIRELEVRAARLTKAVRLLTLALEDGPARGPAIARVSDAAREARELLGTH